MEPNLALGSRKRKIGADGTEPDDLPEVLTVPSQAKDGHDDVVASGDEHYNPVVADDAAGTADDHDVSVDPHGVPVHDGEVDGEHMPLVATPSGVRYYVPEKASSPLFTLGFARVFDDVNGVKRIRCFVGDCQVVYTFDGSAGNFWGKHFLPKHPEEALITRQEKMKKYSSSTPKPLVIPPNRKRDAFVTAAAMPKMELCDNPRRIIPDLCLQFHRQGFLVGAGGGLCMREGETVYMTPSGAQLDRLKPEDMFVTSVDGQDIAVPPADKRFRKPEFTQMYLSVFKLREAGMCVHLVSTNAVLVTLLCKDVCRITHHAMLEGLVKATTKEPHHFFDIVDIPIVDNYGQDPEAHVVMADVLARFPDTNAVLVRRYGMLVWSDDWQTCKTLVECYEHLFKTYVKMRMIGFDPEVPPPECAQRDHTCRFA